MKLSKFMQRKLNEYVDLETRVVLKEVVNPETFHDDDSHSKHFAQIGKRLGEVRGLDSEERDEMILLTRMFTPENVFEFAKRLVGLNPRGILTMQQVLALESDFKSRAVAV